MARVPWLGLSAFDKVFQAFSLFSPTKDKCYLLGSPGLTTTRFPFQGSTIRPAFFGPGQKRIAGVHPAVGVGARQIPVAQPVR